MTRITAQYLHKLGACEEEIATFARLWPKGAAITLPNIRRAVRANLNIEWLVKQTVSKKVWAEYLVKVAPFWANYQAKCAPFLLVALRAQERKKHHAS